MNFLQLVNRLKRKSGSTGQAIPTLVNQVEEVNKLADFINEAWMDIQLSREDWLWMRGSASCVTTAGQATYSPVTDFLLTDFANWETSTFRNYLTSAGVNSEIRTDWIGYDQWRDVYQFGATRDMRTQPIEITVTPNMSIGLGPSPAAGYTITGDYYKVATELVADIDTPAMPAQYHQLIVYRAMMFYGMAEAATEVYQEGAAEFRRMMTMLTSYQQADFTVGGPLA